MSEINLPIVLQLQTEAADNKSSVSGLLRKAKIIATKLEQDEFLQWINDELDGYKGKTAQEIPDYRHLQGTLQALNPYNGWLPVNFENPEMATRLTNVPLNQGIGSMEPSLKKSQGLFAFSLSSSQKSVLMKTLKEQHFTDVRMILSEESIRGIIETVRNSVLDWSLNLEKAGILGKNLNFSAIDKEHAEKVPQEIKSRAPQQIHATSIGTVIISNDTSQVSSLTNNFGVDSEKLKNLIGEIERAKILLPPKVQAEVEQPLARLKEQAYLPQEKQDFNVVSKSMELIGSICEKATGNLVAHGILSLIEKIAA